MSTELNSKLFSAADSLRSKMDASEYKNYLLGLIFYKYLSDKLLEQVVELSGESAEEFDTAEKQTALYRDLLNDEDTRNDLLETLVDTLNYNIEPEYLFNVLAENAKLVYFAGFLIRARIKSEYNAVFVYQNTLTCSYYNYINILSQRSGQPGVNAQEYGDFSISLPTLPEQTKIGDFFQSLDATVALREQELETLKTSKQGFLQKMFPRAQDKASPNCALLALRKIGKKRNWEMWLKLQVEEHQAHK